MTTRTIASGAWVAAVCAILAHGPTGAQESAGNSYGTDKPYTVTIEALKGKETTDVYVTVGTPFWIRPLVENEGPEPGLWWPPPDVKLPEQAKKIQLKSLDKTGAVRWAKNYQNVPLKAGQAKFSFKDLERHMPVTAQVLVQTPDSVNTEVLNAGTVVYLRPDLRIDRVNADSPVRTRQAVNVEVVVSELNQDLGATFSGTIVENGAAIDTVSWGYVPAGGTGSLLFTLSFDKPGVHKLTAVVQNSNPAEWDEANNSFDFQIEVVEATSVPTVYSLWYNDSDWEYFYTYDYYYGTGESTSKGKSESLSYSSYSAQPIQWPVENLSLKVVADGSERMNRQWSDLAPMWQWSWSQPGYEYSYAGRQEYSPEDNAWLYINSWQWSYEGYSSKGSYAGLSRWAGDYVYSSSGYSHWWGDSYSWSYSGVVKQGTFLHARNDLAVNLVLTDDGVSYGGWGSATSWNHWVQPKYTWSYSSEYGTNSGSYQYDNWYAWGYGWTKE
ncbi:MAG: hypothetical protein HYY17_00845 [Planctomycetes bacterium]|nr:hypothetical protein [Planctomycetota bacterium]